MPDPMMSDEDKKKADLEALKAKEVTPLKPQGNLLSTPSPIPGAAVPSGNLPTIAEADKIEEKKHKDALAAKEKSDREAQVEREKQQRLDQEEADRKSKIQRMMDGEAGSVPASKVVKRYNTEDGLPPRYEAGNLEPVNAKKVKPPVPSV